jgi:uncharacterized protein YdaU (DUF1376 family)
LIPVPKRVIPSPAAVSFLGVKKAVMHYYQFHIGDYKSHTHHLSLLEDLAYRRLLDFYFLHEQPIKHRDIARQIGMRDHEEDVMTVLNEFFLSTPEGFVNPRADKEIKQYKEFAEAGKRGAAKRWSKPPYEEATSPPNATPIATINHKPITNNQKKTLGKRLATDFSFPIEWEQFCQQTRPEISPVKTFDQFKDYWIAQAGQKGVKLDWFATWRNWVRSTNAPKQNPYDVVRLTVPSKNEPDAALEKIKADDKKAVPPSLEVLAKMAQLRKVNI